MKNRRLFLFAGVLAACVVPFGPIGLLAAWYFSEEEHRRTISPDGRFVAIITKRMVRFIKPVEIRMKLIQNGGRERVYLDVFLEDRDVWEDVSLDSFPIEWKSDAELNVKGWGNCFRGRRVGDLWVVDSIANVAS